MKTKEGVQAPYGLHPALAGALDVVDAYWRKRFGAQAVVTSISDGTHSEGSLHYGIFGDARARGADIRTRNLDDAQKKEAWGDLSRLLGIVFDVVLESTHLHIEFDLKNLSKVLG